MHTGELYARLQVMREAANAINHSTSQITSAIDMIDAEIRALSPERFMSVGAEAFRAEYNRLTPRLKETFDLLGGFRDKLHTAADDIELAARSMQGGISV